tara:strand:+ start:51 stop:332 length:282 start_codon:yes stop_codon:yes gene_type:complete
MIEAELMGLLRTVLIILIVYYAFRFLARIFGPLLVKRVLGRMQEKAQNRYNQYNKQSDNTPTKEGETIIDKKPGSKNESNSSVGEYVDFEEID